MAHDSESIVAELIRATDAQEFDKYDVLLSDDMTAHFPGGSVLDRAGIESAERAFAAAFPDVVREVQDIFASGDRVVARTAVSGTHRGEFQGIAPTSRAIRTSAIVIYRVDNGRVAELWVEADFMGLFGQLQEDAATHRGSS